MIHAMNLPDLRVLKGGTQGEHRDEQGVLRSTRLETEQEDRGIERKEALPRRDRIC